MSKSRRSQRSAGRNINNYEYKKEVSCKDNYLSDKHKDAREEFIKNNPIVPMNPKQRKYMELLDEKGKKNLENEWLNSKVRTHAYKQTNY